MRLKVTNASEIADNEFGLTADNKIQLVANKFTSTTLQLTNSIATEVSEQLMLG